VSSQAPVAAKTRSMPKLSALMLAIGALALAACGGSSGNGSSTTVTTPPATTSASTPTTSSTSTTASTPTSTSPAASSALTLEANPEGQLKFDKTTLSAKAGKVSIAFTNKSPLGHNLTVESSAGKIIGATPTFQGATKTLTLTLTAGTYKYFCSVPGHRAAGMEGTLTVQ
jgi:plastocyanin